MTIVKLKDGSVELDEEGHLKDFGQWSTEVAQVLAERDGIEFSEELDEVCAKILKES